MDYSILLLIGAIIVGAIIWNANRNKQSSGQKQVSSTSSNEPKIQNMQPGGVFSLRSFGDDMEDLDVSVIGRHIYDEDGFEWIELEGETGGEKIWLTVEDDDELELSVTLRKVRLEEIGLTKEQMLALTDNDESKIEFNGRTYHFDDRGDATYYANGDTGGGEKLTYWAFEADLGTRYLTVERWGDGTFECHISQAVKESQITIYSTTGNA